MRVSAEEEIGRKLRKYMAVTASLLLLALLSFLAVPQGGSVNSCKNLLISGSRYTCFSALALAKTNASICGYLQGGYADSCYSQVALKSENVTTCGSIQSPSMLNLCIIGVATATLNYSACYDAAEPYASKCLDEMAIRTSNASICSGIVNSTYKVACGSEISLGYAISRSLPLYCKNVTNYPDRNLTNFIIVNFTQISPAAAKATANPSSSALTFLPNATFTARDYCYTNLASQLVNNAICANVSAGQARSLCIVQSTNYSLVNATSNYTSLLSSCSQSGAYAQQCVQAVTIAQAVRTKNASMCGTLAYDVSASCYSLLASTYANATYCNYITNATQKEACVSGS